MATISLAIIAVFTILVIPMFLFCESVAQRKPNSKFSAWWRRFMVSNSHTEDDQP